MNTVLASISRLSLLSALVVCSSCSGGSSNGEERSELPDNTAPSSISNLDTSATDSSLRLSPTLNWDSATDNNAVSTYQIALGTTSGGVDVLNWKSIGNVTTHQEGDLHLDLGTSYYVSIRAMDAAGNIGDAVTGSPWTAKLGDCPSGFIPVPADGNYTTDEFCVMQFESKAQSNDESGFDADGTGVDLSAYKPASVDLNQPWSNISRNDALSECRSLGGNYDLISNAQWQTIARNLELVASNWSSGVVGTGCIWQGNNGESVCGYDATTDPEGGTAASRNSRAQLSLSNSEVIYDFSGNLWEWTKDINNTDYDYSGYLSRVTPTDGNSGTLDDGVPRVTKDQFGPAGDYPSLSTGENYGGLGFAYANYSNQGGNTRGGDYSKTRNSGIFAVAHYDDDSAPDANTGFRCIYYR